MTTVTAPSGDIVGTTDTQTLTNKTITSPVISGGTINNTVIGGTTPAAGTFTTFSVAGSLQNLFIQSQTFNTSWQNSALTINQTATTAPDSTSTGNSLIPTVTNTIHRILQPAPISFTNAVVYTASVYAKANGYNYLYFNAGQAFNAGTTFNISTGAIATTGTGSATITSVGNGWYRCTITGTASSTNTSQVCLQVNSTQTLATDDTFAGNGTSGIYLWGAQLETSSTAHAYQVTTTSISSANPVISLSGGGTIGLESNGALYVSPAGTGALQAQATTSSTVGGNARGANAVDWQTLRDAATKVASGAQSVLGGGSYNVVSGGTSVVVGGSGNNNSGSSSVIVGGTSNTNSSSNNGVVGGGYQNSLSSNGQWGFVGGGYTNTAAGFYNFIGTGYTNSGTSGSAVTTQSATMNATTAVTLAATNANIKVGQLITGTSITTFPATYVAAISGTSLTLSQAASGSSTSTLSFYTPHGVVVGGGNNQATGSYSFIGGGGDAGTAANRNVASGDWSVVVGGRQNTASGQAAFVGGGGILSGTQFPNIASGSGAFIGGGYSNTASSQAAFVGNGYGNTASTGNYAIVVGGESNTATGSDAFIGGGQNNTANGAYSVIAGANRGSTRGLIGFNAFPASNSPVAATLGASQAGLLVLGTQTTDATATVLTSNSSAASGTNQVILPNNSAYFFRGEIVSGVTGGGDTKGWTIEGVIKRGAGVGTTTLVGSTVTSLYADAGAATWTIALAADTTNGGLRVTFTGQASTTIRTVCQIRTTEMTY
jgi:hypothetical protein